MRLRYPMSGQHFCVHAKLLNVRVKQGLRLGRLAASAQPVGEGTAFQFPSAQVPPV